MPLTTISHQYIGKKPSYGIFFLFISLSARHIFQYKWECPVLIQSFASSLWRFTGIYCPCKPGLNWPSLPFYSWRLPARFWMFCSSQELWWIGAGLVSVHYRAFVILCRAPWLFYRRCIVVMQTETWVPSFHQGPEGMWLVAIVVACFSNELWSNVIFMPLQQNRRRV